MTEGTEARRAKLSWYHQPIGIALLVLFVLGPLALPLVWRTPAWGPAGRWIATALILLYTVLLGWLTWWDVQMILAQVRG